MDGNQQVAQVLDSCDLPKPWFAVRGYMGICCDPQFAILGRWIPASLTGMTGIQHLCITSRAPAWEWGFLSFPRSSVTAIKLAAYHDVGTGFSPRLDTHRGLKARSYGASLNGSDALRGNPSTTAGAVGAAFPRRSVGTINVGRSAKRRARPT